MEGIVSVSLFMRLFTEREPPPFQAHSIFIYESVMSFNILIDMMVTSIIFNLSYDMNSFQMEMIIFYCSLCHQMYNNILFLKKEKENLNYTY
jgi:hypothetical protein